MAASFIRLAFGTLQVGGERVDLQQALNFKTGFVITPNTAAQRNDVELAPATAGAGGALSDSDAAFFFNSVRPAESSNVAVPTGSGFEPVLEFADILGSSSIVNVGFVVKHFEAGINGAAYLETVGPFTLVRRSAYMIRHGDSESGAYEAEPSLAVTLPVSLRSVQLARSDSAGTWTLSLLRTSEEARASVQMFIGEQLSLEWTP